EKGSLVLVALPGGESWEIPLPHSEEPWEAEFWRVLPDTSLTGPQNREPESLPVPRLRFHPAGGMTPVMVRIRRGMEGQHELWLEPFSAHVQSPVSAL